MAISRILGDLRRRNLQRHNEHSEALDASLFFPAEEAFTEVAADTMCAASHSHAVLDSRTALSRCPIRVDAACTTPQATLIHGGGGGISPATALTTSRCAACFASLSAQRPTRIHLGRAAFSHGCSRRGRSRNTAQMHHARRTHTGQIRSRRPAPPRAIPAHRCAPCQQSLSHGCLRAWMQQRRTEHSEAAPSQPHSKHRSSPQRQRRHSQQPATSHEPDAISTRCCVSAQSASPMHLACATRAQQTTLMHGGGVMLAPHSPHRHALRDSIPLCPSRIHRHR